MFNTCSRIQEEAHEDKKKTTKNPTGVGMQAKTEKFGENPNGSGEERIPGARQRK